MLASLSRSRRDRSQRSLALAEERSREGKRETERGGKRALKGAEGPCSSCQTRVMDISHCGKATNTPWRHSDVRAHTDTLTQTHVPPPPSPLPSPLAINTSAFTSVASRVNATEMKRPHHRAAGPCSINSLDSPPLSSFSNARAQAASRCRIDEQMTLGRATMTRVFTRVRARTPLGGTTGGVPRDASGRISGLFLARGRNPR